MKHLRVIAGVALCFLVITPIMPFYFLRAVGLGLAAFMDWCAEGRAWCKPFLRASDWIERKMIRDYEADYAAWKKRMRERGEIVP